MQSLCETCRHVVRVQNKRGSVFLQCRAFEKPAYFPQPVLECVAYVKAD